MNGADIDPAGIVTAVGSVSSEVLLDAKETTSGVVKVPPICTLPESVWPFQPDAGSERLIVASASRTLIVKEPGVQLSIAAVTVTGIGDDSITWSSRSVAVKFTLACPAGRITMAGTVRCDVPLEVKFTVTFCVGAALAVTVPVSVPPFSAALAGRLTLSVAVRPLWTSTVPVPFRIPRPQR